MSVRVSVVVPVYNPGRYLDACVASLSRQSLPAGAFEVIFVDDGSTDGSGARLDGVAAEEPNMRVVHIENSGWPGRPRNVGLESAGGEYVLFCDHDDWLGDEALERLVGTADRTGADVVVGREVGHGRGVPLELFRRSVDDARLDTDPLVRLLTPHKLFRRALLHDHGIRFPEGRRRFEDHVFVLRAYFAARRISILADYPCYHWVTREGRANASDAYADPVAYYHDLREVLDVVDANTEPGPVRDRLTAHWYRHRCLDRLRGERWSAAPSAHDLEVFEAVRDLARERIGQGVVGALPLSHRLRSGAVTADRPELVVALARVEDGLRARVRVARQELDGAWLRLTIVADLFDASAAPMRFARRDGRVYWRPPDPALAESFAEPELDATEDLERVAVSVVLASEDRSLQHDVPVRLERVLRDASDGPVLSIRGRADVDLRTVAAGRQLPTGAWELLADVRACGWQSRRRLPPMRLAEPADPVHLAFASGGGIGLIVGGEPVGGPRSAEPIRRRSGRHPIERFLPRVLLRRIPTRARQAGKRILLQLGRR